MNSEKLNKPRLILADIDGTLVNEPRDMLPLTRDILNYLHNEKNILFGIASGRPCDELPSSVDGYHLDFEPDLLIGMNGGEIIDNIDHSEQEIYPLEPEAIKDILDLMAPFDFANAIIYRDHQLVASWMDDLVELSCEHAHKTSRIVEDRSEFWSSPTGKIMFRTPNAELCRQIEEFAQAHPSLDYTAFRTQPTLLEFQDPRVNKGRALKNIAEKHHIPVESIIGFGDASNDNEMLKDAGLGVCMINGLPDTKESADELTAYDNNHDGMVRYIIDRFPDLFKDYKKPIPEVAHDDLYLESWD